MAGYSKTPLDRKLGLKDGQRVAWIRVPDALAGLAQSHAFAAVETVARAEELSAAGFDVIHLFTASRAELAVELELARARIAPAGMIWVSWPKKASKVPSDVTEDVVRELARAGPLVDVKVCAVDKIWSGLKLVIRKELRGG